MASIPVLRLLAGSLLMSVMLGLPLLVGYRRPITFLIAVAASTAVLFAFLMVLAVRTVRGKGPAISWVPKGEFSAVRSLQGTVELARLGRPVERGARRRSLGAVMTWSGCIVGAGVALLTESLLATVLGVVIALAGAWLAHRLGLPERRLDHPET